MKRIGSCPPFLWRLKDFPFNRQVVFLASCVWSLRIPLGCIAPLDEGGGRRSFFPRGDFNARDTAGMNAGAGVVIGTIGMELLPYALCADVGFEIHPFREGEVFIDGPMGVAGNDA